MPTSRMLAKQVVATYAGVLFDAADAAGAVDDVYTQLDAALRLVRSHAPLRDAMADDAVPGARRAACRPRGVRGPAAVARLHDRGHGRAQRLRTARQSWSRRSTRSPRSGAAWSRST